jgi:hypothetical protein
VQISSKNIAKTLRLSNWLKEKDEEDDSFRFVAVTSHKKKIEIFAFLFRFDCAVDRSIIISALSVAA